MAQLLDWDPVRGLAQYEDVYDGHLQVHYRQDVEPVLDLAKTERINGIADKATKHADMHLYARIPPVVILEMKYKHGVDIFSRDKGMMKKAVDLINREYPYLKTTEKHHQIRHG